MKFYFFLGEILDVKIVKTVQSSRSVSSLVLSSNFNLFWNISRNAIIATKIKPAAAPKIASSLEFNCVEFIERTGF